MSIEEETAVSNDTNKARCFVYLTKVNPNEKRRQPVNKPKFFAVQSLIPFAQFMAKRDTFVDRKSHFSFFWEMGIRLRKYILNMTK